MKTLGAAVGTDPARVWLAYAVLTARLPREDDIVALVRKAKLDGAEVALKEIVSRASRAARFTISPPSVEVVRGSVIVDVHHTARTRLATGIQRVVRQTIAEWATSRTITLIGWNSTYDATRLLTEDERSNALYGNRPDAKFAQGTVTIPWECDYILPELATEPERTARLQAMARFSGNRLHMVGHDCVPISTAETVGPGMGGAFAKNLAAARHASSIATTSMASSAEYQGWRSMLSAIGVPGPRIQEVQLPAEAGESDPITAGAAADIFDAERPLVLCVGSHEPRKNHMALLYAFEVLWREGHEFNALFVGGNSWNSGGFEHEFTRMVKAGRPLHAAKGMSDDTLWAMYRDAVATVFPSVNEGFGLPVAESLAVGTPALTSNFGSMREIAQSGGAVLVDPRDDDAIVDGLRRLLTDDAFRAQLEAQATARSPRLWKQYAAELWESFFPED
ncbi:glycosyltransferase family 1 protein [Diaminobutyricimonas sp. LJ205]|uniref:glycosyltransferase family 4 protein n=1 Tax=Diaminobutyricimonas sp. LJ205 TaxID=2683590 RepID=UPI0012F4B598|nr:glycosyltransferase family 1 protein [Diaminobutyricimonas sp. LJ205]